jgi:hypothetical protein
MAAGALTPVGVEAAARDAALGRLAEWPMVEPWEWDQQALTDEGLRPLATIAPAAH